MRPHLGGNATVLRTNQTTRSGPERSCIGCGAKRPKQALIRLVLSDEGQPQVDAAQTALGRGAYLCGAGCLTAAAKRKAFQRAFRGAMKGLALEVLGMSLKR